MNNAEQTIINKVVNEKEEKEYLLTVLSDIERLINRCSDGLTMKRARKHIQIRIDIAWENLNKKGVMR